MHSCIWIQWPGNPIRDFERKAGMAVHLGGRPKMPRTKGTSCAFYEPARDFVEMPVSNIARRSTGLIRRIRSLTTLKFDDQLSSSGSSYKLAFCLRSAPRGTDLSGGSKFATQQGCALVQGRDHLSSARPHFPRQQRRWNRRFSRAGTEARLPAGTGDQRDLADAIFSFAAAG